MSVTSGDLTRLEDEIVASEAAMLAGLAAIDNRISTLEIETRTILAEREKRFACYLEHLEGAAEVFLASVKELRTEW